MDVAADDDPRQKLVDWMADPKNPFFARAVANRYWAHFFGRGIVDPLDDMRVTNPPSNPELLDALAKDLVDNKYSLKHLVKTICKSRTYQLVGDAERVQQARQAGVRPLLPAAAAGRGAVRRGLPGDRQPDGVRRPAAATGTPRTGRSCCRTSRSTSYFLDVFGRPQRISACECERVSEANLAQALHLLNCDEVQDKLARAGGRADRLAKDPRPDAEKVEELFLWAFGPQADGGADWTLALEHIAKHAKNKKLAYENILWALINTKEFVFNQ